MFIELHLIQNFAPANLNRDDANNPKDCEFGGVRRARISSQCIKRSVRLCPIFGETTEVPLAVRTKFLVNMLRDELVAAGKPAEEAIECLTTFVPAFVSKLDKKSEQDKKTAVLLYLGAEEVSHIVQGLLENWENRSEKNLKKLANSLRKADKGFTSAPDIALFGRMLAERPQMNLEAACQVAHAISTHRVSMDMDFFTAVDDLKPDDTSGAGMVGFTGFNSSCFYRYSRVDWRQLVDNLNGDLGLARRTVEAFLRASLQAVPSGKQNSFAAQNPPSFGFVVVRQDGMGWSLANAFEEPVYASGRGGLVVRSVEALDKYWGRLCQTYGTKGLERLAVLSVGEAELDNLGGELCDGVEAWLQAVLESLPAEAEAS